MKNQKRLYIAFGLSAAVLVTTWFLLMSSDNDHVIDTVLDDPIDINIFEEEESNELTLAELFESKYGEDISGQWNTWGRSFVVMDLPPYWAALGHDGGSGTGIEIASIDVLEENGSMEFYQEYRDEYLQLIHHIPSTSSIANFDHIVKAKMNRGVGVENISDVKVGGISMKRFETYPLTQSSALLLGAQNIGYVGMVGCEFGKCLVDIEYDKRSPHGDVFERIIRTMDFDEASEKLENARAIP
jgi:hypothetical protein